VPSSGVSVGDVVTVVIFVAFAASPPVSGTFNVGG
jgi:hypothetical protein